MNIFSHVMPLLLVLVSHDASGIINGTNLIIWLTETRCGMTFWSCAPVGTSDKRT